jgi:hypothetical protein
MPIIRILTRLSRATHGDPIDPIEFHQTGPLGRNRGALPRLRGRGEQGDIVTPAYVLSTLCIGIFDQFGKLVGLIDVLRGYRTRADWYIGLMLLAPGFQGKGSEPKSISNLLNTPGAKAPGGFCWLSSR